ncbi:MAG: hypothetical protein JG768_1594 [Fusobacteriales bacterium]|jgi:CRP-like cAMP-binding protein|nr:hypothetical protein [Fusobacteriales bacterium]
MKVIKLKARGILYFENTEPKEIYVLKSGRIYLKKEKGFFFYNNKINTLKVLNTGDMFGFEEIFIGIKREARAIADVDSEILSFEVNEFSDFIKNNIEISKKMIISLSREIRELDERVHLESKEKSELRSKTPFFDMYVYFISKGDFLKASQVLKRMIVNGIEIEFAKGETKRIEKFLDYSVTIEKIDLVKKYYEKSSELLIAFLKGLRPNVIYDDVLEKLLLETIDINVAIKKEDEIIDELEEFIEKFQTSSRHKEMMFLLLKIYEERKNYTKAFQVGNLLMDADLDEEEKIRFREMITVLKEKLTIERKGEGNV